MVSGPERFLNDYEKQVRFAISCIESNIDHGLSKRSNDYMVVPFTLLDNSQLLNIIRDKIINTYKDAGWERVDITAHPSTDYRGEPDGHTYKLHLFF